MTYRAYQNEAGEYTALEYEYDGPPDPDKWYNDSDLWGDEDSDE